MNILKRQRNLLNSHNNKQLWEWINIMFNKVDEERLKLHGPDRTCAEWLLRNGASVKWQGSDVFLTNYNRLPPEGTKLFIKEVDGTESSIKHYGFPHFDGCKYIDTLILNKCYHVEDKALEYLYLLEASLTYLQISSCRNISANGLLHLSKLRNLKKLILFDLPYVRNKQKTTSKLQEILPNCSIEFK